MKPFQAPALALMVVAVHSLFAAPDAPPEELLMPARLRAEMTIVNGDPDERTKRTRTAVGEAVGLVQKPKPTEPWVQFPTTSAQVSITIRRWSLEEEQDALRTAIASGSVAKVMKAMKELPTLGDISVGGETTSIRAALTWMTEHAQRIRLVVTARLVTTNKDPFAQTGRALDIVDLSLPFGQPHGSGSLVTATKVGPETPGLIAPVVFAIDSVTQPISRVERLPREE